MKYIPYLLGAALAVLLLDLALRPRVRTFDAANCAEYLNTDSGTNYTAQEIDQAFSRAMTFVIAEEKLDAECLRLERLLRERWNAK